MKYSTHIAAMIATLFLISCANTPMTQENKNALSYVCVDPPTITASEPEYFGTSTQVSGLLLGPLGTLLNDSSITKMPQAIAKYLKDNNIDIADIARQEFIAQLKSRPGYSDRIRETAKNHFVLEIPRYGVFKDGMISNHYKTIMRINAKLVDEHGAVIWAKDDYVTIRNDEITRFTLQEYFSSPDAFTLGFHQAARAVTKSIVQNL